MEITPPLAEWDVGQAVNVIQMHHVSSRSTVADHESQRKTPHKWDLLTFSGGKNPLLYAAGHTPLLRPLKLVTYHKCLYEMMATMPLTDVEEVPSLPTQFTTSVGDKCMKHH